MAPYNGKTLLQMRQSIQRKCRSTDTATGTFDLITGIDRAINDAMVDLVSSSHFEWTVREFWWNTVPPVASLATQAVSVAAGSDHVTASGNIFTAGMVGSILFIGNGRVPYEIRLVSPGPAPDSARIVVGFEGTTNQTAAQFRIVKDSFTLNTLQSAEGTAGDRIREIKAVILESGTSRWPMVYVPPRDWDKVYPRVANESQPYYYTIIRYTADGVPRLRFWPIPSTRYVLRLTAWCWLPELVNGSETFEIPGPAHRVIEDIAYVRVMMDLLHQAGPEVQLALARAEEGKRKLVRDNFAAADYDMVRGVSPYAMRGMPVAIFPPSHFGQSVEFP